MKRKELTRERAQELANELGIEITGTPNSNDYGHIYLYANFTDTVKPKAPWHYPRATDADRGKVAWYEVEAADTIWMIGICDSSKTMLDSMGRPSYRSGIRLADPDNLTVPPPDGLED